MPATKRQKARKAKATKLTVDERRLTALQRAALELALQPGGATLLDYSDRTIESLQERRLIDEVKRTGMYVVTERGRAALAYHVVRLSRAAR
jgi:hypothetical protein